MRKKWIILFGGTALAIAAALFLPQIVMGAVLPEVTVVRPEYDAYYDRVSATGKIEEAGQSSLTAQLPLVPKEVYVNLGDQVEAGDVLAEIDFEQSKQALLSLLDLYDDLPEEIVEVMDAVSLDQEQMEALIPAQITADYTGVVSALNLTEGAVTQPAETLATIADLSTLRAVLQVPEDYASSLAVGQEVTLKIAALDQKKYHGRITTISPTARETLVGTAKQTVVDVYVSVEDQDDELKAGYTATGTIRLSDTEQLLTIPYSAIDQQDSGSEYVYLYEDGKAKMRVIATGQELSDSVEVTGGLKEDDWVIAQIDQVKRDGEYVTLAVDADD